MRFIGVAVPVAVSRVFPQVKNRNTLPQQVSPIAIRDETATVSCLYRELRLFMGGQIKTPHHTDPLAEDFSVRCVSPLSPEGE